MSSKETSGAATTDRSVFVGETIVMFKDMKKIESIAFPNEDNDDLVLLSTLDGKMSVICSHWGRRTAWYTTELGRGLISTPRKTSRRRSFARRSYSQVERGVVCACARVG